MDITAHFVRKITAEVYHSNGTHWINLTVHEVGRHSGIETSSEIQLFTDGANASLLAEMYAAAINRVNSAIEAMDQPAVAA